MLSLHQLRGKAFTEATKHAIQQLAQKALVRINAAAHTQPLAVHFRDEIGEC